MNEKKTSLLNSFYEGHSIQAITFPIRVLKLLGIETLIGIARPINSHESSDVDDFAVTNAAGGLNPDYAVGDIVILSDVRVLELESELSLSLV